MLAGSIMAPQGLPPTLAAVQMGHTILAVALAQGQGEWEEVDVDPAQPWEAGWAVRIMDRMMPWAKDPDNPPEVQRFCMNYDQDLSWSTDQAPRRPAFQVRSDSVTCCFFINHGCIAITKPPSRSAHEAGADQGNG